MASGLSTGMVRSQGVRRLTASGGRRHWLDLQLVDDLAISPAAVHAEHRRATSGARRSTEPHAPEVGVAANAGFMHGSFARSPAARRCAPPSRERLARPGDLERDTRIAASAPRCRRCCTCECDDRSEQCTRRQQLTGKVRPRRRLERGGHCRMHSVSAPACTGAGHEAGDQRCETSCAPTRPLARELPGIEAWLACTSMN